jgi:hypothetical protein
MLLKPCSVGVRSGARQARRQRALLRKQLKKSDKEAGKLREEVARLRERFEYTKQTRRRRKPGVRHRHLSTLGLYRLAMKRNVGHSGAHLVALAASIARSISGRWPLSCV